MKRKMGWMQWAKKTGSEWSLSPRDALSGVRVADTWKATGRLLKARMKAFVARLPPELRETFYRRLTAKYGARARRRSAVVRDRHER